MKEYIKEMINNIKSDKDLQYHILTIYIIYLVGITVMCLIAYS